MKHGRFLTLCASILLSTPAQASMDWTDHCAPDQVALKQAMKDFPEDRYDESTCADSVYRRGTCEVRPEARDSRARPARVTPASTGANAGQPPEEAMKFHVRLRSNVGMERQYEVIVGLDREADGSRVGDICQVREVKRSQGQARGSRR